MEAETNAATPSGNFAELVRLVEECKVDHEKALNGNKSSSTRVRNNMSKIKALTLIIRKEMLETRKK